MKIEGNNTNYGRTPNRGRRATIFSSGEKKNSLSN